MNDNDHLDGKTVISMLRAEIAELRERISAIDEHGTHYLPVTSEKALDLAQRLAALEARHNADMSRLESLVEAQEARQVATARWRLGFTISLLAMIAAVMTMLVSLVTHHLL